MKRRLCALFVVTDLAACTTLSTAPYGEGSPASGRSDSAANIAAGDRLHVRLRDGTGKTLTATTVSADELCAVDGCLRTTEIAHVERVEMSVVRTVLLIAFLAAMVVAIRADPISGGFRMGTKCWFCE